MRHVEVKIKRDTQTTYVVSVPEWEVPIIEFLYDDGNVEQLETVTTIDREYPSAEYEFDRLTKAYGKDSDTKVPIVAAVYGNAGAGVRALKKAMLDAQTAEGHKPAPVKKQVRKVAASSGDSLLA